MNPDSVCSPGVPVRATGPSGRGVGGWGASESVIPHPFRLRGVVGAGGPVAQVGQGDGLSAADGRELAACHVVAAAANGRVKPACLVAKSPADTSAGPTGRVECPAGNGRAGTGNGVINACHQTAVGRVVD